MAYKKSNKIDGNCQDPLGMGTMLKLFLEDLAIKNFSKYTITNRRRQTNDFIRWSSERSLQYVHEIHRPILQRYQRHLFYYRTRDDKPLTFRSQHTRLTSIRCWFAWMTRNNYLTSNPAADLELPKLGQRLPHHVLSHEEAEAVLNQTDPNTPLGLRDRSIIETFYSTGIRRSELANLDVYDLDIGRGVLRIRAGKGNKDRVIPIGQRALAWAQKYQFDVRPDYVTHTQQTAFYLSNEGQRLSGTQLGRLVSQYIADADIGKQGSCHLFRHTMATVMLENGADIRYIQTMLGHANLDTTQIYTRVSIRKLKEIHTATHPAKTNNPDPASDSNQTSSDSDSYPDESSGNV